MYIGVFDLLLVMIVALCAWGDLMLGYALDALGLLPMIWVRYRRDSQSSYLSPPILPRIHLSLLLFRAAQVIVHVHLAHDSIAAHSVVRRFGHAAATCPSECSS